MAGSLEILILPSGLGLLGFVEPCSLGGTMLFIKFLQGKSASAKLEQVIAFTASRMLLIGTLAPVFLNSSIPQGRESSAWNAPEESEHLPALGGDQAVATGNAIAAPKLVPPRRSFERFAARSPFSETADQESAVKATLDDLASGRLAAAIA